MTSRSVNALAASAAEVVGALRPTSEPSTLGYVLAGLFVFVTVAAIVGWWSWGRRRRAGR